ncbi:protein FAM124A [Eucyclogobius newberryi]|uniref:protein FAM124A n=1 Tax=Eucyclogobius newberryi TaxID=166745 RepID=UPI003B596D3B
MEKTLADDDCVDSGAETGGSDYSPLSSTSINGADFMADPQDPYLVSIHLIADPDQGGFLQHATDAALAWIHPDLQLFRVSERAHRSKRRPPIPSAQPALAIILFLQESYGSEEHILSLHRALQRPPWRYHHTEKVSNGKRMLPLTPCSQDFFTLTPGTPLWAVRQVHYGKEIVRLTIYCRHENYVDMVRLYKLLLQKRVAQKKEDFCFFLVYSNADLEIQLSFKRLQKGQAPSALDSALLEVRVRDVCALVPLLPHTCSPISDLRWQTQDYDGNKILLQVQTPFYQHRPDQPTSAPSTFARHSAPYRHHPRRHPHRSASFHSSCLQTSQMSLPSTCDYLHPDDDDDWPDRRVTCKDWTTNHCGSLFSLPNRSASRGKHRKTAPKSAATSSLVPPFRLNVDALIGAEETDVDTGDKVAMDLSVVSAYIQASLSLNSRPVSAPPEDVVPSRSPSIPAVHGAYKAAAAGGGRSGVNRSNSLLVNGTCSSFGSLLLGRGQSSGRETSTTPSVSSVSVNHSDSCSVEDDKAEEEEEFYI